MSVPACREAAVGALFAFRSMTKDCPWRDERHRHHQIFNKGQHQ